MSDLTGRIAAELRSLRKGRGVHAADLRQRLGPHLRELAESVAAERSADTRRALITQVSNAAAGLAVDLRAAITASLGLSAETARITLFRDRIVWLTAQIDLGYRTALRRVDAAEQLVAEQIAQELLRRRGRAADVPQGWHLQQFRTILRLDTPTPEAHEHRRIMVTESGLNEVIAWLNVPDAGDGRDPRLQGEVLYGGELIRRKKPRSGRLQFMIRLPRTLRAGESHEYGLLLRVPPGEAMRPHYIFTPECPCEQFDLRVKFPRHRLPRWVRLVDAEPVRVFDAAQPGRDLLTPDRAGEVHVQFDNLTMYLGYGVQWAGDVTG